MLSRLGLSGQVVLPKVNVSDRREGSYRAYYTDASRELIASWYAPEVREFGYRF